MDGFTNLPLTADAANIQPFKIHVEEQKVQDLKTLIRLSPIVQNTYENQVQRKEEEHDFGVTREWLVSAKKTCEDDFDWYAVPLSDISPNQVKHLLKPSPRRAHEAHLNSFPQY